MPENDERDVPAGAQAPVETKRERFERERLSRRQALKRFGMTSAMTAFALFSVDDLARMVGKAMQQRAGDNKVAEQVAQEFQEAGVSFAASSSQPCCTHCSNQQVIDDKACLAQQVTCDNGAKTQAQVNYCAAIAQACISGDLIRAQICNGHCNVYC